MLELISATIWPTSSTSSRARSTRARGSRRISRRTRWTCTRSCRSCEDSYGVRMTDEQAAQILDRRDRRWTSCSRTSRTDDPTCVGRRSAMKLLDTKLLGRAAEELARQVFTHASWSERRSDSYARLAFLGDSVLGLAVTAHLYPRLEAERFGAGRLTKIRAQAVSGPAAGRSPSGWRCPSGCARRRRQGVRESAAALVETERVLASVIEAVIGACYLNAGYERTAEAVVEAFAPEIEQALEHPVDFKSALQELLARRGAEVSYEITGEDGPAARAHLRGGGAWSTARRWAAAAGRSKKHAEQEAAREAVERRSKPSHEGERADAAEVAHAEGLQVVPRPHAPGLRPGRQRRRRAQRLGQVERHRRGAVGDGRAVAAGGARPVDAGRDLRRRARRAGAQRGRGRDRARQLRRHGRPAAERDLDRAAPRSQRARADTGSTARAAG